MEIRTKKDIIQLIKNDQWMMEILKAVKAIDLPEWWVCAGFVRSKIWDTLHGFEKRTPLADIDVVYFDSKNTETSAEKEYEKHLQERIPNLPWSVKNQARMHAVNGFDPYESAVDAISKFPETVTALGVRLDEDNEVILTAPCGIEDAINMEVWPTRLFSEVNIHKQKYKMRIQSKNWQQTWPKVKINGL
ncbi:nucleotidyltransferase family protein [Bacillus sp. NEB1478]|uniref:nucleotidyltransferase family protein n=1 Tax=Bacillus sp. NEB1478 TaxID=3073816 RepID=UPI002873E591|nr:nucleotidyltransferase family protein [Bacillus sp. NEB1478]WNB91152.1 nucleotidyltransferase family protein [Bacillus sp. NEB1478]